MIKLNFLLVFLFATLLTYGQSTSKLEVEIRKLEHSVVTAILKADTNTLKQFWAKEFLVNTPRNDIAANRDAVLKIQKAGMIDYSTFEKVIEHMQFQKNIVVTMGHETFVSKNDAPGVKAGLPYKRRFTNVWMKKKGKWQQIARHASIICH